MLQPYIECTNRCTEMTADVMGFMLTRLCNMPVSSKRNFLNQADALLSSWLVNLGEFTGRFYKKHPYVDLHGLLTVITKRINSEVVERVPGEPVLAQKEYKGESLIRVVLESLIEYMGGYSTVTDMNEEQLLCLAGGPRLRGESISFGKKEETGRKEKAKLMLLNALVDLGLVRVLWTSLSQQSNHFLSEEFSEAHGAGGLKLLGLLFDGINECFLKITDFLAQACTRERYLTLIPPFQEMFQMFMPALAFLAIRNGLPLYGRGDSAAAPPTAEVVSDSTNNGTNGAHADLPEPKGQAAAVTVSAETTGTPETDTSLIELEKVARANLPPKFEESGLSIKFYITFWRLSLQDICVPNEGYERMLKQTKQNLEQIENQIKTMENSRGHNQDKEIKALKKEQVRVADLQIKLKAEWNLQKWNHQQVLARMEKEKDQWFVQPGPDATIAFVQHMIYPRVVTAHADTQFCCQFVKLLIKLKTPGFQLLDFYNCWTIMLTQSIRCCSEREAEIFGGFLRESMSYMLHLRRDEQEYAKEIEGNPCFHRNYYMGSSDGAVEWTAFSDFRKGHSKWEGRLQKGLRQGLDSEDWMEKRNALLLLSQSYEFFPVVEKYAKFLLQEVEKIKDKEDGFVDLKTLAGSLAVKLKSRREYWVDKQPAPAKTPEASKTEKPPAKSKDAKADDGKEASKSEKERGDRQSSTKRQAGEEGAQTEKRSRREEDGTERRAGKEEGKDGKEAKESKEAKEGKDRSDTKAAKDDKVREVKEVRDHGKESKSQTAERRREKDAGEKPSRQEKDAREGDRKERERTSSNTHDERGTEKRRRTEREADAGEARDRYADAGDRGDRQYPRNALTEAPPYGDRRGGDDYSRGRSGGGGGSYQQGGSGGGGGSRHADGRRR